MFNDLLHLTDEELNNTKIRFVKDNPEGFDPLEEFKRDPQTINVEWFLWRKSNRVFTVGQYGICLVCMSGDRYLFTSMKTITKDLGVIGGISYEGEEWERFAPLYGRVILKYHKSFQQMAVNAPTAINELEVLEVLPDRFADDPFPGYDNVCLSYAQLQRIVDRGLPDWTAALSNQKGVYLIADLSNGRMYVGSATAKEGMLLKRWTDYVNDGHGGNVELKKVVEEHGIDYVRRNFQYTLLENYNARVDDRIILQRESWWKNVLATRDFGYNDN